MLERKKGIPVAPDKLEVHRLNDSVRTVQCNLFQESYYAYTSWVITDEGVVIIDTGTGTVAPLVKEEIARETDKPIKYIIYTHGHFDHTDRTTINIIPREIDLEELKYVTTPQRGLLVTDGKNFNLDISKFTSTR